jgi:hypothetical protein
MIQYNVAPAQLKQYATSWIDYSARLLQTKLAHRQKARHQGQLLRQLKRVERHQAKLMEAATTIQAAFRSKAARHSMRVLMKAVRSTQL